MSPDQFATAIGIVESNGDSDVPLGDDGRALGRWQIHPDEMWTWAKRLTLAPQVNETWDSFVGRLIKGFYSFHTVQTLTDVQIAMTWHLGHISREDSPDWDLAYADKFRNAARTVQGG